MITILQGDVIEQLRTLPNESVHCCVTSPPYWGLRDYGTAQWEGGEDDCDHAEPPRGGRNPETAGKQLTNAGTLVYQFAQDCGKCGAKRIDSQLGLEKTPEEYVEKLVAVFRGVRRVLRPDGTLWLNLGSSYTGSWGNYGGENRGAGTQRDIVTGSKAHQKSYDGLEKCRPPSSYVARRGARKSDKSCKAQSDSQARDCAYLDLCDECEAALSIRNIGKRLPIPESPVPSDKKDRDKWRSDYVASIIGFEPPDVSASTSPESSEQSPVACCHCANCGACLSVLRSSSRDASLCARKVSRSYGTSTLESERRNQDRDVSDSAYSTITFPQFKAKDLVPIPWMVAMALQADGWWLRSDIIWAKPNPMPESVTDRPTKAHEYLFLLTKSANYFYDAEAIKEKSIWADDPRADHGHIDYDGKRDGSNGQGQRAFCSIDSSGRNKRSVWTVATAPYPEAHFATYPPDLIKPCILAGTSAKGCCAKCGSPWERIVERSSYERRNHTDPKKIGTLEHHQSRGSGGNQGMIKSGKAWNDFKAENPDKTIGWQPTCKHYEKNMSGSGTSVPGHKGNFKADGSPFSTPKITTGWKETCDCEGATIPCTVLDPFAGSGTTGAVALELGRKAVLIELNPKYVELIERRCSVTMGLPLAV